MQQQHADYDLLAVFSDEAGASAATAKLQKEGYGAEEVFQLTADAAQGAEYREHGPSQNRSEVFLQRTRARPNWLLVLLLALALGIVFGGAAFLIPLLLITLHVLVAGVVSLSLLAIIGAAVGVVVGAVTGYFRRGRERGDIGQNLVRERTPARSATPGARTVVAVRLPDAEDIRRRSRAQAILVQGGGKIDRSVRRNTE